MNKRIRELAKEAGIKMTHDDTLALGYLDTAHKKFAKLIIDECCSEIPYGYAETIKEHFGVEE